MLTQLAEATFSSGIVPDTEVIAREAAFLFAAGQETTVRLITFSMRYLAENPDAQERLRQRRELIPNFLEEMLRLESPIKGHFRDGSAVDDPRRNHHPGRHINHAGQRRS